MAQVAYHPLANGPALHDYRPAPDEAASQDGRVQEVAKRSFCGTLKDVAEGLWNSKIIRAVVLSAAVLVAVFFLVSNPVGWMVSGVITLTIAKAIFFGGGALLGGFALSGARALAGCEKTKFEMGFMKRRNNFDEIIEVNGRKLILGALPNRFLNGFAEGEELVRGGAVLSINSPWERENRWLSLAYKPEHWTHELRAAYYPIDVPDHTLLTPQELDRAANFINEQLTCEKVEFGGRNVYVHCKAGQSRSAAAIAAYLMKYGRKADGQPYTIEEVCKLIQQQRPKARLVHKISSLVAYDDLLMRQNIARPPRSQELTNAAQWSQDNPGKDLPKATVRQLLG